MDGLPTTENELLEALEKLVPRGINPTERTKERYRAKDFYINVKRLNEKSREQLLGKIIPGRKLDKHVNNNNIIVNQLEEEFNKYSKYTRSFLIKQFSKEVIKR